jgi:methyl-accepting chemotaxis protein
MRELACAAERIGGIVGLINDIAGKTNLLALNATIEAARAGDAGRGFAVVAQEVKALADQTGKATAEIGDQIAGIQSSTEAAAAATEIVSRTTRDMNSISSNIAAAVEQQGAATQEIARNMQDASQRSRNVSANLTNVRQAAENSNVAADRVLNSAAHLNVQSENLRREMAKFVQTVRSA